MLIQKKIKTIVLAEDDEEDVEFFKDALSELQIDNNLTVVENGVLLINFLEKAMLPPDFVFMDLNMPFKNGLQCLKEIRSSDKWKTLKTIILTTSSNDEQRNKCYEMGADLFLTKPSSFKELKNQLSECLE
jgi:CheY-like chemotaxis protein